MSLGSTFSEDVSLDACYGSSRSSLWPATLYLRLYGTNPMTGGTELTGAGGYAPVTFANDTSHMPNASSGQKITGQTLTFPTSSGAWSATATYFWLTDASANLLDGGPLAVALAVPGAGYIISFPAGSIVITAA